MGQKIDSGTNAVGVLQNEGVVVVCIVAKS